MKASKAPEKIYLYPSDIPDQKYEAEWGCQPWDESSVEYTRTDAFIEKAWEFWMHKFPYIGIDIMKEFVDAMKEK